MSSLVKKFYKDVFLTFPTVKVEEKNLLLNSCPLCEYKFSEILFERKSAISDYFYKIVRCQNCSLAYQYPSLNEEDIKRIYDTEYFENPLPLNIYGYKNYGIYKDKLIADWRLTLQDLGLSDLLNNGNFQKRILDVGCAYGFFLDFMRSRGYLPYGVDISFHAVKFAREKLNLENVFVGELESLNFGEEFFDIVTMFHIIEHLTEPKKSLKEVHRILKKDGILILQFPVIDSLVYKIYKKKWRQFRVPEHTFYFSKNTISLLLKKTGFSPLKFRSWGSGLTQGKVFSPLKKIADFLAKKFDIGDVMAVAAKKILFL
jgi:2-polyprenyl-3-methyl-5-hydroxy-6-metoxy-1,4-benzoquinol methylase